MYELTKVAFVPIEMSNGSEPQIVDGLRDNGDLSLSLVGMSDDQIVGYVAFSPVAISEPSDKWFGLDPVSVHPDHPRAGIGRQLIETGVARIRSLDAAGCVFLGEPTYSGRFGFSFPEDLTFVRIIPVRVRLKKGEISL